MHDSSRSLFELIIFKMIKTWISSYFFLSTYYKITITLKELRCSAQVSHKDVDIQDEFIYSKGRLDGYMKRPMLKGVTL